MDFRKLVNAVLLEILKVKKASIYSNGTFSIRQGTLNVGTTQKGVNMRCFGELGRTIFMVILWSALIPWSFYLIVCLYV